MEEKSKKIMKEILEQYLELSRYKEIFDKKYFKYSQECIDKIILEFVNLDNNEVEKKQINQKSTKPLRNIILAISTQNQVKEYLDRNLKYSKSNSEEQKKVLKKISADELKYLYYILYETPIKAKDTKKQILQYIENYFENIERTLSMKL